MRSKHVHIFIPPTALAHSLPSGYCMRLEISCLLVNFASCLQRMGAFCCHAWCALMCYHPATTVLLRLHGQTGIFITCCSMVPATNSGQRRRLGGQAQTSSLHRLPCCFSSSQLGLCPKSLDQTNPKKEERSSVLASTCFNLFFRPSSSFHGDNQLSIYLLGTLWSKLRYKWCKSSILQFAGTASDKPPLALSTTRVAKRQT